MSGLRVAVVGAGPAGMYAIDHLLEQGGADVRVDLYERLATPWGLVRSGVAPDHPEKKRIADRHFNFALHDQRVRFFGCVEIGANVTHDDLAAQYHAVVYAVGAGADLRMGIADEDLPGCISARSFVGFYNGHPDAEDLTFDLSSPRAVIIGNGNVALDIARILSMPIEDLAKTDISDRALALIRQSAVREVMIVGRRGPAEAAFNNPELEELAHIPGVDIAVTGAPIPADTSTLPWLTQRKLATLAQLAERPLRDGARRIVFHFLASPLQLLGTNRVERLRVGENRLEPDARGGLQARPSGREEVIETGLVLRAIGYRGTRLPGLPFDERSNTIPHDQGRIIGDDGGALNGAYVTGWIKRGCRGIIGSNRLCARETVDHLLRDVQSDARHRTLPSADPAALLLRNLAVPPVTLAGWQTIDRHERDRGRREHRPRVKITDRQTQRALAAEATP